VVGAGESVGLSIEEVGVELPRGFDLLFSLIMFFLLAPQVRRNGRATAEISEAYRASSLIRENSFVMNSSEFPRNVKHTENSASTLSTMSMQADPSSKMLSTCILVPPRFWM